VQHHHRGPKDKESRGRLAPSPFEATAPIPLVARFRRGSIESIPVKKWFRHMLQEDGASNGLGLINGNLP
jgi:hypothetical protein